MSYFTISVYFSAQEKAISYQYTMRTFLFDEKTGHRLRLCPYVPLHSKNFPIPQKRPARQISPKERFLSDKPLLKYVREKIRTPDLLIRSQTLYPAELRAHSVCFFKHRTGYIITQPVKNFKYFFVILPNFCQPLLQKAPSFFPLPHKIFLLAHPAPS